MAKIQRLGLNSTVALSAAVGSVTRDIPLPEGVILRDDDEMVIWRQFTNARAPSDWRDMDLILLAKIVRVEADIRKHQKTLDATGPLMKNPRGTPVCNPMLSYIDILQRQQLAIIRSLSLMQTDSDPRTLNATGKQRAGFGRFMASTDDLIARPDDGKH